MPPVLDDATKAELRKLPPERRPLFGDPESLADLTVAEASQRLTDPSRELIVWVDDRHSYTDPGTDASGPIQAPDRAALENYSRPMAIGDNRVAGDRNSIPRPCLPVRVCLPLLSKNDPLEPSGSPPRITDNMRRAIGPVRVDWTFMELPPDASHVPTPDKTRHRAHRSIQEIAKSNSPELIGGKDGGGIRPQNPDAYYKAPLGFGSRDSLLPWLAFDDSGA